MSESAVGLEKRAREAFDAWKKANAEKDDAEYKLKERAYRSPNKEKEQAAKKELQETVERYVYYTFHILSTKFLMCV